VSQNATAFLLGGGLSTTHDTLTKIRQLRLKKGDLGWQFSRARKRAREWKNYSFQEAHKSSGITAYFGRSRTHA